MAKKFPSMQEIIEYINSSEEGVKKKDISRKFKIKGEQDRIRLKESLNSLKESNKIEKEKGRFVSDSGKQSVEIEITGKDSEGNFIARLFHQEEDLFQIIIPHEEVIQKNLKIGDFARAKLTSLSSRISEAKIIRKLAESSTQMVGVFLDGKVQSVDRRFKEELALPDFNKYGLKNKDVVLVRVLNISKNKHQAELIKKIGSETDAFSATLLSIYAHSLPLFFHEESLKQTEHLTEHPLGKRVDLRDLPFVTVDDKEAKDFDDAVYAEPFEGGFKAFVAIADVSSYILPETPLDNEALERGNSVYFPDRVLPMFPEKISNELCSLRPNEDKSVLVAEIILDKNGNKKSHSFKQALIRSKARLTYDEVEAFFCQKQELPSALKDTIPTLHEVYLALTKARDKRGVLNLEIPEPIIKLNDKGEIKEIVERKRYQSHKMIEELMILANVAAAEELESAKLPTMYRVHESPSKEKFDAFLETIQAMNLSFKASRPLEPKDFTNFLKQNETSAFVLNELVLRSQSQARYSSENLGHFGLNLKKYAHFTSPIRRYADVLVHRALRKKMGLKEGILPPENEFERIAEHISQAERNAMMAEREADERYIAYDFKDKIGQVFDALIASVTEFGLFVRVGKIQAEGFLPLRLLGRDYFEYDKSKNILVNTRTKETFSLGDKISVILKECSPLTGGLLFIKAPKGSAFKKTFTKSKDKKNKTSFEKGKSFSSKEKRKRTSLTEKKKPQKGKTHPKKA
ncbi:MAG: ribonuclease R [Alphaproteobacteria bacterium]|nr:ribonuclease R [Alphaproteobacteria bacterium]